MINSKMFDNNLSVFFAVPLVLYHSYNAANCGYLIALLSTTLFSLNNKFVLSHITPESIKTNERRQWKWRNIANSLLHSTITGVGACFCFWKDPRMREDLIHEFSDSSHILISLSIGYFLYDLIDMSMNDLKGKTYELLLHHFLVILCFTHAMTERLYMGYALMALLLEVNSIFLHVRQLMIIQHFDKSSTVYRINNSFNLGTFVVFRILTLGWMTRWLLQHRIDLTSAAFNLAAVSLAIIMGMNILLLQRILKADYLQVPKPVPTTSDEKLKIS